MAEFRTRRAELAEIGLRQCTRCGEVKPLESGFDNDRTGANGKAGRCKECRNASARERHNRNDGLQGALDNGFKRAAKAGRRRKRFSVEHLLKTWERNGIDPWKCYYTGVELTREPGLPNTRQLDHIEALATKGSAGHVARNVVPCAASYNGYKHDHRAVTRYLNAPEHLAPIASYAGLGDGMAGVDGFGTPLVPARAEFTDTEDDAVTPPPQMGYCQWLRTFAMA